MDLDPLLVAEAVKERKEIKTTISKGKLSRGGETGGTKGSLNNQKREGGEERLIFHFLSEALERGETMKSWTSSKRH